MALYSLANLAVRDVASTDRRDVALNQVLFERDGTTAAGNGRAVMAVSPVDPVRAGHFPTLGEASVAVPEEGVGVAPTYVAAVARTIPTTRSVLKYALVTRSDTTVVELMTTNGHEILKRGSVPARKRLTGWRKALGDACRQADRGRVCVDAVSLVKVLQAMIRACPDKGNHNPVYVEFGGPDDAIVLRAENYELNQRALATVVPLRAPGWLEADGWEEAIRDEVGQVPEGREKVAAGASGCRRLSGTLGKGMPSQNAGRAATTSPCRSALRHGGVQRRS